MIAVVSAKLLGSSMIKVLPRRYVIVERVKDRISREERDEH